ncbi:MAG: Ig-like domain-containing protein [Muribaculaceae bacterium]|nr:Ig-like domain-containing protein [Muribaculaceae bacterium]
MKPGTVTITVSTANGKTAKCEVTVIAKEPEIIYVTSITLDHTEIEAVTGTVITLTATVLPEDATDKELLWSSSNDEVASVDETGTVTIHSEGIAVITAEAADGSGIKAECHISGTSLLDSIENDSIKVDVFTVNGMLIKSKADSRFVSNLAKGTYIIRVGNVTHKIIK